MKTNLLITPPAQIARLQNQTVNAQGHREDKGLITLYHRKKSGVLLGGSTPFNKGVLTADQVRRAENLRLGLFPSNYSPRARAIRGLVDTSPDEWLFQPSPSLVEQVLVRAELGVEDPRDPVTVGADPEEISLEGLDLDSALLAGMGASPDEYEWSYEAIPEEGDTPQELKF